MRNPSRLPRLALAHAVIALLGLAWPLAAIAHNWSYGFAWADGVGLPSYEPAAFWAYNDAGTPPRIERSAPGKYSVTFPHLDGIFPLEANVQVTAYGEGSEHCKAQNWAGDTVTVLCWNAAGSLVDTQYSVLFLEPDLDAHAEAIPGDVGGYAYALADQPASASYSPDPAYAWNPAGGTVTATRSGPGVYSIVFTDLSAIGSGGGHVQVTAVGVGSGRCRIQGWGPENVDVRCYDATGAPADSAYSVLYWRTDVADPGIAFAWADQSTSAVGYTPNAFYSFNAGGGTIVASRISTGRYEMLWNGMSGIGVNGGNVLVTAYGGGTDVRCKVVGWSNTRANVRCFDAAGNPANSQYTVLFLKTPKKPWAREFAFTFANHESEPFYNPLDSVSFNPVGGADFESSLSTPRTDIEISRVSPGVYQVHFLGFGAYPGGGNVQVNLTGSASQHYCKVDSWTSKEVVVRCFDGSGSPSDATFHVLYLKAPSANTSVAYAWAEQPSAGFYTPNADYSHNPAGGPITAGRTSPGIYDMKWSGFGALEAGGGHVQVTAYGTDNARCQVEDWADDAVQVRCFDAAGNPADSMYSVLYLRPGPKDDGLAFAWADQPTTPAYTPHPLYSFNAGYPVAANDIALGAHQVTFEDFRWRGIGFGAIYATGFGAADNRCHYSSLGYTSTDQIQTACRNAAGAPTDAQFDLLRVKPVAVPEPGQVAMLASGAALLALLARERSPSYARVRHQTKGTKNA